MSTAIAIVPEQFIFAQDNELSQVGWVRSAHANS